MKRWIFALPCGCRTYLALPRDFLFVLSGWVLSSELKTPTCFAWRHFNSSSPRQVAIFFSDGAIFFFRCEVGQKGFLTPCFLILPQSILLKASRQNSCIYPPLFWLGLLLKNQRPAVSRVSARPRSDYRIKMHLHSEELPRAQLLAPLRLQSLDANSDYLMNFNAFQQK